MIQLDPGVIGVGGVVLGFVLMALRYLDKQGNRQSEYQKSMLAIQAEVVKANADAAQAQLILQAEVAKANAAAATAQAAAATAQTASLVSVAEILKHVNDNIILQTDVIKAGDVSLTSEVKGVQASSDQILLEIKELAIKTSENTARILIMMEKQDAAKVALDIKEAAQSAAQTTAHATKTDADMKAMQDIIAAHKVESDAEHAKNVTDIAANTSAIALNAANNPTVDHAFADQRIGHKPKTGPLPPVPDGTPVVTIDKPTLVVPPDASSSGGANA